jgi:cell division protein FtsL
VAAEVVASVVLPILFVNRRLAELSVRLSFRQLTLAILPPLLLLAVGVVVLAYQQRMGLVTVVMLPFLCVHYYMTWRELVMIFGNGACFLLHQ